MINPLFSAVQVIDFCYAVPLIAATSFVYAATRHEKMEQIIPNGVRISLWIAGFLAALFLFMIVMF